MWHNRNIGNLNVNISGRWYKIWKLAIPHKMKIFLWRFCRNNIPVRKRLNSKGISLPIICLCVSGILNTYYMYFFTVLLHVSVGSMHVELLICTMLNLLLIGYSAKSVMLVLMKLLGLLKCCGVFGLSGTKNFGKINQQLIVWL